MPSQEVQDALAVLRAHNYKCYRPYTRPEGYGRHEGPDELFLGKVIDTETTGLHADAKVFEVGVVVFEYDAKGVIYGIRESVTMFEDIGEPLPEEITSITGRPKRRAGQRRELRRRSRHDPLRRSGRRSGRQRSS